MVCRADKTTHLDTASAPGLVVAARVSSRAALCAHSA